MPLAVLPGGDLQGVWPAGRARRFAIGRVWNVRAMNYVKGWTRDGAAYVLGICMHV